MPPRPSSRSTGYGPIWRGIVTATTVARSPGPELALDPGGCPIVSCSCPAFIPWSIPHATSAAPAQALETSEAVGQFILIIDDRRTEAQGSLSEGMDGGSA